MDKDEHSRLNKFVSRLNRFHLSKEFTKEISEDYRDLFEASHEICEALKTYFGDVSELNRQEKYLIIDDIFSEAFNFVLSEINEFRVFENFVEHYPECMEAFGDDVEELLKGSGDSTVDPAEYISDMIFTIVYKACRFTSLLYYVDNSTEAKSMSLRDFIHKNSSLGFSDKNNPHYLKTQRYSSSDSRNKTKTKNKHYHMLETETDRFKKSRNRMKLKNSPHKARKKWHEIPSHTEHVEQILYDTVHQSTGDKYLTCLKKLNAAYSEIYKAHKSLRDDDYKDRINKACKDALIQIERPDFEYKGYLEQSEQILQMIQANEFSPGIDLYRFELSNKLYGITKTVKELLEAETEDEIDSIGKDFVFLNDIAFPELYEIFGRIESHTGMRKCVSSFKALQFISILMSKLIIDEFVDVGYFGDEWYVFFVSTLNELADEMMYSPDDIDFSIGPKATESQERFKEILSLLVNMYYVHDEFSIVHIMENQDLFT